MLIDAIISLWRQLSALADGVLPIRLYNIRHAAMRGGFFEKNKQLFEINGLKSMDFMITVQIMEQLLWADVWIFRVNFFRDYMKKHPGFVLADGSIYDMQIYDCVYDVPGENLDGWYCEKCKGLVIYVDIIRNREQVLHRLLEE